MSTDGRGGAAQRTRGETRATGETEIATGTTTGAGIEVMDGTEIGTEAGGLGAGGAHLTARTAIDGGGILVTPVGRPGREAGIAERIRGARAATAIGTPAGTKDGTGEGERIPGTRTRYLRGAMGLGRPRASRPPIN